MQFKNLPQVVSYLIELGFNEVAEHVSVMELDKAHKELHSGEYPENESYDIASGLLLMVFMKRNDDAFVDPPTGIKQLENTLNQWFGYS